MADSRNVSIEQLSDLATPWCLRIVVTLKVAELIREGVDTIAGLAQKTDSNAEALHGVLGHLVQTGIFEEPHPGRFVLNEAANQLLDPRARIGLDLTGIGGRMSYIWSTLPQYVQTGNTAYAQVFGKPFWEDLEANPAVQASFDELIGPTGHGDFSPEFDIEGGWGPINSVVDVGGGTGAMLSALLQAHPKIRGVLVDQARTIERSRHTFTEAGLIDRVRLVPQSFFDALPSGEDLYLLRGIINDWPDDQAIAILRRCAEAARPNGRVIVLKGIRDNEAAHDIYIEMLLAGGKSRSVDQFRRLANQSGLRVVTAGQQAKYFVVECRPV